MTEIVQFIIGIIGRIVSGLFTTYIVRLVEIDTKITAIVNKRSFLR